MYKEKGFLEALIPLLMQGYNQVLDQETMIASFSLVHDVLA